MAERAGLQPAHVEQVLDQPGRAGPGTPRRWRAARPGRRSLKVDVGAAQAVDGGLGRGERGAQVVADRGRAGRCAAGRPRRAVRPRRPARPAAPGAGRPRPGRRTPRPPAGRRRPAIGPRRTSVTARRRPGPRRRRRRGRRTAVRRRWRRPARRRRRAARSGPRSGVGSPFQQGDAGQPERLADLVEQGGQRPARRAARCRPGWTGSRASARARAASPGAPGGQVDDGADRRRRRAGTTSRASRFSPLGDGEPVQRRGEEVVEQQRSRPTAASSAG